MKGVRDGAKLEMAMEFKHVTSKITTSCDPLLRSGPETETDHHLCFQQSALNQQRESSSQASIAQLFILETMKHSHHTLLLNLKVVFLTLYLDCYSFLHLFEKEKCVCIS